MSNIAPIGRTAYRRAAFGAGIALCLFVIGATASAQETKLPPKSESKAKTETKAKDKSPPAPQAEPEEKAPSDTDTTIATEDEAAANKVRKDKDRLERLKALVVGLTVFVLAVFVGFEVIAKVPPTLHTPLMSGSNAISGITIVGSIMIAGQGTGMSLSEGFGSFVGCLGVALAAINVVGGFLVTHRMLAMFKRR